mmetsp:Transcript_171836/g.545595  ORF Transcript_171836/g.545595 Transcript_171836/m.545595 type:complete len:591 (-) Transcript_171836:142-1914(-)
MWRWLSSRLVALVCLEHALDAAALVRLSEDGRRGAAKSAALQSPLLQGWMNHVQNMQMHFTKDVTSKPPADKHYKFEVKWFEQKVDHINKQHSGRFWQRYFVYEKFTETELDHTDYPLFVFCGAEQGDIYLEWQNFGFMLDIAREHGAKVLYLEHRFFGQSKPYGAEAFELSPDRVGLLSIEQSMADYVEIIKEYRGQGPVLTFGGSLSGTIAAMMRIQFPTLIDMAFASSAPVLGVVGVADQFAWRKRLTDNFAELGGADCPGLVRRGFNAFVWRNPAKLREAFGICEKDVPDAHWDMLLGMAWQELENLGNFPYPAHQSGIPLACTQMREVGPADDAKIFAKLLNLGPGGRLPYKCLDLRRWALLAASPSAPGAAATRRAAGAAGAATRAATGAPPSALGTQVADWAVGWSYMACTEVVHPIGANNVTDMFPPYDWTVAGLNAMCEHAWKVAPDVNYLQRRIDVQVERRGAYPPAKRTKAVAGRILFSWGTRDPWGTMVPSRGWADDVEIVEVPGGGHCSDLQTPGPEDTEGMRRARANISAILGRWLMEVRPVRHMKLQPFGNHSSAHPGQLRSFGKAHHAEATAER